MHIRNHEFIIHEKCYSKKTVLCCMLPEIILEAAGDGLVVPGVCVQLHVRGSCGCYTKEDNKSFTCSEGFLNTPAIHCGGKKTNHTEESKVFLTKHARHQPLHFGVDSSSPVQSQGGDAYTHIQACFKNTS